MPRRSGRATVARKAIISAHLSNRIDLLLADPARNKIQYGSFSHITEDLWLEYLNKIDKECEVTDDNDPTR